MTSWAEFEHGLAMTTQQLASGSYLIISMPGTNVFVQFHQTDDTLYAEAVADQYLADGQHLSLDQVGAMRRAGWQPPTVDPDGYVNWHRELPWPATSDTHRELAAACIASLRIRGVVAPRVLTYKAWREPILPDDDGESAEAAGRLNLPGLGLHVAD